MGCFVLHSGVAEGYGLLRRVTCCRLLNSYRRFEGSICLHLLELLDPEDEGKTLLRSAGSFGGR
jgi:hypothetical protein